jgi:putative ABC transport system permease protein
MRSWLRTRLRSLFRRDRLEWDLDRELAFHVDMLTQQNLRAGMAPGEARRLALRHFGGIAGVKEAVRETWLSRTIETFTQDVRYGVRNIGRSRGFAFVVVITMALGIGANTAIFSVVNGVLLRPLPYADPERLVVLRQHQPSIGNDDMGISARELDDYRAQSNTLDAISEFHEMWFILLGGEEPQRVSTGVVSSNFFNVLGVRPMLGRDFVRGDEQHEAAAVLILSNEYWQRAFHGDATIIGRVFEMNDRPHRVVGVLPPTTPYPSKVDVYMPTSACPFRAAAVDNRASRMAQAIARMRAGVSLEDVRSDLGAIARRFAKADPALYPPAYGFSATATPIADELTRSFSRPLLVLLGTAAFVLLIVCASLANLTLARIVRREDEMTVRAALGASRLRLVRQLATESTMLALAGGVAGLLVAAAGLDTLVTYAARFTPRAADVRIDRTVLLFSLGISAATGLIFGTLPFLVGRLSPRAPRCGRSTPASQRLRTALIVAQVAVSFMLLVGAGLTIRTFYKLQQVDPGFRTDHIMTMRIDLNFTKYDDGLYERVPFWQALEQRLRAIPGVLAAGGAGTLPLSERGRFSNFIHVEGHPAPDTARHPRADVRFVSPGYFDALEQPLVEGRVFSATDPRIDDQPLLIVNHTMAQHYWAGQSAIGKRVSGDGGQHWGLIVGVVADTRQQLNEAPRDEVYVSMFERGYLSGSWLVRSNRDDDSMIDEIKAAVQAIDPDQPVDRFRSLADVRRASLAPPRLTATLLGLFAALALVITATGMAGVIAYSVSQRTQEFGIRMALGAGRGTVLAMVLRQGLRFVAIGLGLGTVGALLLTRLMTTLLFGVEPTDIITFFSVALVLVVVAAIACLIPARRAASVDPLVALRVG